MSDAVLERDVVASPAKDKPKLRLRRLALFGLGIAAAMGVAWYGYGWWIDGRFIESTDDAYVGGNVTPISPHVAGFVSEIPVIDNQYVQAGQLLVRLDNRDFQAAADHAEAVLQQRKANLVSLQAKYVLQQSTIRQAAADLDAKIAQATFAKDDAERYRNLVASTAVSRQDAQKTVTLDQQARSAVVASEAGLAAAKQQLAVLDAQVSEAGATIAQAEADLRTARLNLDYTEIRSPIDGYIGNRAAQVGAYVSQGAYLVTIIPAHGLWIDANFKEDQLERMEPGQSATVVADLMSGHVFRGRVVSLARGTGAIFSVIPPENATGNFTKIVQRVPVRIEIDADDAAAGRIRPGLSIVASVDTRANARQMK
jgi:membrane fusion protein, multidrug efflux system